MFLVEILFRSDSAHFRWAPLVSAPRLSLPECTPALTQVSGFVEPPCPHSLCVRAARPLASGVYGWLWLSLPLTRQTLSGIIEQVI